MKTKAWHWYTLWFLQKIARLFFVCFFTFSRSDVEREIERKTLCERSNLSSRDTFFLQCLAKRCAHDVAWRKIRRRARRARGGFKIRIGRSRKWVRVFQEAKTHSQGEIEHFLGGERTSYSPPLRSCCVYTYTPSSPADCRLTLARFPTSSIVLLTVPDTHTEHCTQQQWAQCMSSLDVVSTS